MLTQALLTDVLVSQYKASLLMLRATLRAVPPALWNSPDPKNRSWRLLYHTLWSVRYYLGAAPEAFEPWPDALEGAESLGAWWDGPVDPIRDDQYHTPAELLRFLDSIDADLRRHVEALPLEADSGFPWYPCSRLELHLNTIRHVQHHTAQLIERLRAHGISGIAWAGTGNEPVV